MTDEKQSEATIAILYHFSRSLTSPEEFYNGCHAQTCIRVSPCQCAALGCIVLRCLSFLQVKIVAKPVEKPVNEYVERIVEAHRLHEDMVADGQDTD